MVEQLAQLVPGEIAGLAQLQGAAPAAKDGAMAAQVLAGIDPSKLSALSGMAA